MGLMTCSAVREIYFLRQFLACRCLHFVHLLSTDDYASQLSPKLCFPLPCVLWDVFVLSLLSLLLLDYKRCAISGQLCAGNGGENKKNVRKDKRVNLHPSLLCLITSYVACSEREEKPPTTALESFLRSLAPVFSNVM